MSLRDNQLSCQKALALSSRRDNHHPRRDRQNDHPDCRRLPIQIVALQRGIELGFYSFSKLLMIRDLEPAAWGETAIVGHPLLRGLLTDWFADEPLPIESDASLDEHFEPANLVQVVDADSSQTIVIETAREERNLVVQGPPGTGKSQTIANIVAAAVHDGRSVLFVAEKMAALNVVHQRC